MSGTSSRPRRVAVLVVAVALSCNLNAFLYKSKEGGQDWSLLTKGAVGIVSFVLTKPITFLLDYLFKVRARTSLPCFAMRSKGQT